MQGETWGSRFLWGNKGSKINCGEGCMTRNALKNQHNTDFKQTNYMACELCLNKAAFEKKKKSKQERSYVTT